MKYPAGRTQPPPKSIWGVDLPLLVPDALFGPTQTMMLRVAASWWRSPFHRLRADAELAQWIAGTLITLRGEAQVYPEVPRSEVAQGSEEEGIKSPLREVISMGGGVREWAAMLSVHPRTLSRRCRSIWGISARELYQAERLSRAEALLLEEEMSIVSIAKWCGFASREAFSAWFATETGLPPAKWRAQQCSSLRYCP